MSNTESKPEDIYSEGEIQEWFDDEEETVTETATLEDLSEKYARTQLRVVRETKDYTLDIFSMP